MKKILPWQVLLGISLVALSAVLYLLGGKSSRHRHQGREHEAGQPAAPGHGAPANRLPSPPHDQSAEPIMDFTCKPW